jgi:hypothetical protein
MISSRTRQLFNLISGLWVGSFFTIAFMVVPTLFSALGDRQVAGIVAASIFKYEAYLSVFLSAILMVAANYFVRRGFAAYRIIRWILLGMLACAIAGAFILIPWMNGLRDQALYAGLSVRESTNAVLFALLHAASSSVFMIQSVLGLILVWRSSK